MKKIITIIKISLKEYFVYRLNFFLWRVRAFINLLIIIFLWGASLKTFSIKEKQIFISYLIYGITISYLILGTRTTDIADDINSGRIINTLLKPISFFRFYFYKDLADKAINLFFAIIEAFLIVKIFNINLIFPKQILFGLIFLINGVFISFFINLLISFIGFWSRETWGPRFLFTIIVSFISGGFFPLNILPKTIYQILMLTPFPYLYYLPTRIFLGERFPFYIFFLSFFWLLGIFLLTKKVWITGNKSFSFWGK